MSNNLESILRIGLVIPSTPPTVGGAYTIQRDVLHGFVERSSSSKHELLVLGWDRECDIRLPDHVQYAQLPDVPRQAPPLSFLTRAARKLARMFVPQAKSASTHAKRSPTEEALNTLKPDVLVHTCPFVLSFDIPYASFVWDLEHRCQPYFPEVSHDGQWEARESLYRTMFGRAAFTFTSSTRCKEQIGKFYGIPAERIVVLPHPTPRDAMTFGASIDEPHPLSERDGIRRILYPAQFWPHKNHIASLEMLRILRAKYGYDAQLVFVGSNQGNQPHIERHISALGLNGNVELRGYISREALLRLYCEVDVIHYPSLFGPDNLPPLEAFALGCPVVAAKLPGALEQYGDAAILVDPHDHEGFADSIHSVFSDHEVRNKLIEKGYARAAQWSSADVADRIFALLDQFENVRKLWD